MEVQLGREIQRAFREEGIDIVTGNDFQQVKVRRQTVALKQSTGRHGGNDCRWRLPGVHRQRHSSSRLESSPIAKISVQRRWASRLSLTGRSALTSASRPQIPTYTRRATSSASPNWRRSPPRRATTSSRTRLATRGHHRLQRRPGGRLHQSRGRRRRHDRTGVHERTRHLFLSDCPDGGRPAGKGCQEHGWARQVVKHHETDEIVGVHMVGPAPPT